MPLPLFWKEESLSMTPTKASNFESYKAGYLYSGDKLIATIYNIPASQTMADRLGITRDMHHQPVWQVRDTGKTLEIYYEAKADTYNFPVYKKAEGDTYKAALKDIENIAKKKAA